MPLEKGSFDLLLQSSGGTVSPVIRQRLRQYGVTDAGITQLIQGHPVANPQDRKIIAQIALDAVSDNRSQYNQTAKGVIDSIGR